MEIIVLGTHEYFFALHIFARQYNAYFDTVPITHYGDIECKDLPGNFTSKRVPCFTEGAWPWEHWFGHGLISILDSLVDDLVLLFLPDHWLLESVDKKGIYQLAEYMKANPDVVRGNLTRGICLESYGESVQVRERYEIVQVHPNHPHCGLFGGMAGAPALWNRKNLKGLLESHWDLWQVEKLGTEKMARLWPQYRSVGIRPAPVLRAHGLSRLKPHVANFEGMNEKDIEACAKMLPGGWMWTN